MAPVRSTLELLPVNTIYLSHHKISETTECSDQRASCEHWMVSVGCCGECAMLNRKSPRLSLMLILMLGKRDIEKAVH